jgi:hypothetical protein
MLAIRLAGVGLLQSRCAYCSGGRHKSLGENQPDVPCSGRATAAHFLWFPTSAAAESGPFKWAAESGPFKWAGVVGGFPGRPICLES